MIYTREKLEQLEDQWLAPYGMRSRDSKGRIFPDREPDYRTSFQRDRDRVLHTTAFRRLEYKTQVFVNFEGDYFRTRLTHTLEVAQIGRTIARSIGVNEDLAETICLVHDLGHPAFGHSGESTLNKLMAEHGGFDHNKQTLRIVTKLEKRYPDWRGLNLTWEVLEGIVKHETEYDESDASDYDPELTANLEAQIANVADELAYSTHDLDDGLRYGLVKPEQLKDEALWQMLVASIGWDGQEFSDLTRHRLIRRMVGVLVSDVVDATSGRIEASGANSVLDIQKLDDTLVHYSEEIEAMVTSMKSFLHKNMYMHSDVTEMGDKAEMILTGLFEKYCAIPNEMPSDFREAIERRGLFRTVADYLAGMTDRFATQEYRRLIDPDFEYYL
jgi:dGTPase